MSFSSKVAILLDSGEDGSLRRRSGSFRKRATIEIIQKSWEKYPEGESPQHTKSVSSEDAVSVSSLALSEHSTEGGSARRRIRSFKTLALIVRVLMGLLPKTYIRAEILFEEQNGEKLLKAGTLEAIVAYLTPSESSDAKHLKDFLLTYRYYAAPEEVLEILMNRFKANLTSPSPDVPAIIPLRVINFIRRWLKDFYYDFDEEENTINMIERFIETDIASSPDPTILRWAEPLRKIIKEQAIAFQRPTETTQGMKRAASLPASMMPNQGLMYYEEDDHNNSLDDIVSPRSEFTNINPVEIFRQLTMMEVNLFRSITPKDLYFKTFKKQVDRCPNLMKMITQFNNTSFWVAKEICFCQSLKQRTVILKRFIHIAQLCHEWKNFNTCLEVVGGLSMTCVQRLKKTWKNLPAKYEVMWRDLQKLMAPTQNYIAYRNYFKTIEKPALPYFGVYLSDISVIQEKYATKLAGEKINFAKMRMIANVISDMQLFQSTLNYPFGENPTIQRFLDEANGQIVDEDELYSFSKVCEASEDALSKLSKFSLKSPRHKSQAENRSIEKFDFTPPSK